MEDKIIYLQNEVAKRIDILQDEIEIVRYVKNRVKMKVIKYVVIGSVGAISIYAIEDIDVKTILLLMSIINGTFMLESGVDLLRKTVDIKKLQKKLKKYLRYFE